MAQAVLFFVFAIAIGVGLGDGCSGGDKDPVDQTKETPDTPLEVDEAPAAPEEAHFSVSQQGSDLLFLWSEVASATSYDIYLANEPLSSLTDLDEYASLAGGVQVTGLSSPEYVLVSPPSGVYFYAAVVGRNDAGESIFRSSDVSAYAVASPAMPSVVALGNDLVVSWPGVEGVSNYKLYIAPVDFGSADSPEAFMAIEGVQEVSVSGVPRHRFSGITRGQQIFVLVTSVYAYGDGETQPSPQTFGVLPEITGLNIDIDGDDLVFTWEQVPFADSYNLYLAREDLSEVTELSDIGDLDGGRMVPDLDASGYRLENAEAGEYFAVFTALASGGEGPASEQTSAFLLHAPEGIWPVYVAGSDRIRWVWQHMDGALSYALFLSDQPLEREYLNLAYEDSNVTVLKGLETTEALQTALLDGQNYYASVLATWQYNDEVFETAASDVATVRTLAGIGLNDSGMQTCANISGGANATSDLDCVAVGSGRDSDGSDTSGNIVPAGQDAHFGRDEQASRNVLRKAGDGDAGFDYLRLNADGTEYIGNGVFAEEPWACVYDNVTGLIWEVKTSAPGKQNPSSMFTWYDPDTTTNGGVVGYSNGESALCLESSNACNTAAYVDYINILTLCGLDDWQVPTRSELRSLLHFSGDAGASVSDNFPFHNANARYWTATPHADVNQQRVWVVNFASGDSTLVPETPALVRLVARRADMEVQP